MKTRVAEKCWICYLYETYLYFRHLVLFFSIKMGQIWCELVEFGKFRFQSNMADVPPSLNDDNFKKKRYIVVPLESTFWRDRVVLNGGIDI